MSLACVPLPVRRPADSTLVYRQRFAVTFDFPVWFTEGAFDPGNTTLVDAITRIEPTRRHRVALFIDDGVAQACPALADDIAHYFRRHAQRLELAAAPERLPGGEQAKNDGALVARLQRRLQELGMDRHSVVVAVGGGAVLDLIGYVAATTHRGVRHVRMPTTVLAQNDSGVGVKNGVNAFGAKNFLGTFAPPFAVVNDYRLLDRLPARDKIAGMAEAVKVALIRDGNFFAWIEHNADALAAFDPDALRCLIRRCAELHMHQIAAGGDPFEMGSARPLDYGHWSAHKLETLTGHTLRHGEAVAIGIALDARYSVNAGLLPPGTDVRICRLLERLGFRLWHPELASRTPEGGDAILCGLREFREHLGGELTVTLLAGIGDGVEVHAIEPSLVLEAIAWLKAREATR